MKRTAKLFSLLSVIFSVIILPFTAQAFGSGDSVGVVTVKSHPVWVMRNGKKLPVSNFGLKVKLNDVIKTETGGKAQVSLHNGNNVFIASKTEIQLTEQLIGKKEKGVSQLIKLFYGKVRAKIQSTRKKRFVMKTATATIGVKGTDFITEFSDNKTRVGTLEGLVNLLSDKTKENVDVPAGSIGSVSITGELMPLEEFAGELMEGVEFAGEKMEADDIAGEKLEL
jgi:hypothetical protein